MKELRYRKLNATQVIFLYSISAIKFFPFIFIVENYKLAFLCDGRTVVTSGECGRVLNFNIDTSENIGIYESAEIFSTSISVVYF